jgi:hypothetical protein
MQSARRVYALLGPLAVMAAIPCAGLADDTAAHLLQIKAMFDPAAIVSGPDMVDCTLSGKTKTTCFRITGKSSLNPDDMGPWSPAISKMDRTCQASGCRVARSMTPTAHLCETFPPFTTILRGRCTTRPPDA